MESKRRNHQPSPVEEEEEEVIGIPVFPQEIVVEILTRLPVKSLCRFRCVSKNWLLLIKDPHLAISHFKQTITNDCLDSARNRVIIYRRNVYSIEYESIGRNDENLVALELDHPKKEPNATAVLLDYDKDFDDMYWDSETEEESYVWKINIFGSCNGLVCIAPDPDTLFLFNPSTRESKRIPDSPSGYGPKSVNLHHIGFGFFDGDYKIVKVCYGIFVYSLRTDSWRVACHSPYHGRSRTGVFLNGAFHWFAYHVFEKAGGTYEQCVVVAFSLEKEVLFHMPAPSIAVYEYDCILGVLNGCLCALRNGRDGMRHDFWVMKEYGMGESWTRVTVGFSHRWMKPLCLAQNGETLLLVDGKLLLYNFEDGSYRYLVIDGLPDGDPFEAYIYVETLVSPNAAVGLEF